MNAKNESGKLSLTECKRILNVKGQNYTDIEILAIRNWLYLYTEITLTFLNSKSKEDLSELKRCLGKIEKK